MGIKDLAAGLFGKTPQSAKEKPDTIVDLDSALNQVYSALYALIRNPEDIADLPENTLTALREILPRTKIGNQPDALGLAIKLHKSLPAHLLHSDTAWSLKKHIQNIVGPDKSRCIRGLQLPDLEKIANSSSLDEVIEHLDLFFIIGNTDSKFPALALYAHMDSPDRKQAIADTIRSYADKDIDFEYAQMKQKEYGVGFSLANWANYLAHNTYIDESEIPNLIDIERVQRFIADARAWVTGNPEKRDLYLINDTPACFLPPTEKMPTTEPDEPKLA